MRMPCMHCAHLGECDVLAHLQLDQVLLAVDDLQVALRVVLADVARAKVADAVDDDEVVLVLGGDLGERVGLVVARVLEVALADHRAADDDLASWHADGRILGIGE